MEIPIFVKTTKEEIDLFIAEIETITKAGGIQQIKIEDIDIKQKIEIFNDHNIKTIKE